MTQLSKAQINILLCANHHLGGKWYKHYHTNTLASLFRNNLVIARNNRLFTTPLGKLMLKQSLRKDYENWRDALRVTANQRNTLKLLNQLAV